MSARAVFCGTDLTNDHDLTSVRGLDSMPTLTHTPIRCCPPCTGGAGEGVPGAIAR